MPCLSLHPGPGKSMTFQEGSTSMFKAVINPNTFAHGPNNMIYMKKSRKWQAWRKHGFGGREQVFWPSNCGFLHFGSGSLVSVYWVLTIAKYVTQAWWTTSRQMCLVLREGNMPKVTPLIDGSEDNKQRCLSYKVWARKRHTSPQAHPFSPKTSLSLDNLPAL